MEELTGANLSIGLKASWSVLGSTVSKTHENYVVYVTAPLQLSDAGAGVVFGRKLDRPWLSPTLQGTLAQNYLFVSPSAVVQASGLLIFKPDPTAFIFRNRETKFKFFDTFYRGFSTELNNSHWDSLSNYPSANNLIPYWNPYRKCQKSGSWG